MSPNRGDAEVEMTPRSSSIDGKVRSGVTSISRSRSRAFLLVIMSAAGPLLGLL